MAVTSTPIRTNFRITNMQDEVIQSYQRFRHDISLSQAEQFMDAITFLRGHELGNGFLTVTNELAEA
ncbi:MAG: hypothetical protein FWC16_01345 [Defluviitaleaceae bacterium]|nr:hypothetical protein [Defluviitaleaceae bacterium]MCL2273549.1 hypothetical protein [Defluviitaleaceae bacterium]